MVVGRQPHGGQNEQNVDQIIPDVDQINAFNGLFGVSGKLIFASACSVK